MATREDYARWCMMLVEGDDLELDEMFEALYEDGFVDDDQEWIPDEDDDED